MYWLFKHKNVMPWDAYPALRAAGTFDVTMALALHECDGWKR